MAHNTRVTLVLDGLAPSVLARLSAALQNDEHVHLADLFGPDTWRVHGLTYEYGPEGTRVTAVTARTSRPPPDKPTDKFGSREA